MSCALDLQIDVDIHDQKGRTSINLRVSQNIGSKKLWDEFCCVALRGFSLRGFGDVRGFDFCDGKKGLRLPLAVGKRV